MATPTKAVEMTAAPQWNPRFVAYARGQGRSPEEQLAHDAQAYPGGKMVGFIVWISAQWARWLKDRGYEKSRMDFLSTEDHADFDAWLTGDHKLEH